MDVLIKGMEMPKEGCKDCLLVKRKGVFDICPFLKREVGGNVERGGKPLACPLVEVPTFHGRLIDADKLIKTLNKEKIPYNADVNYYITSAPTIVEAEENEK